MPALALTDHDAVYGAVPFVEAARQAGIKPILGAEVTLEGGAHLTLLAADETGWGNLCRLISLGRGNAPKGEAALPLEALEGHTGGLIALSGCRHGVIASALLKGDRRTAMTAARHYQRLFGPDGFWIEMQHHLHPQDDRLNTALAQIAERLGLGLVATNNVHYATPDEHRLQDVLVSIRHLTPLHQAGSLLRPNSEYYLKSAAEMAALFGRYPEAVANTRRIADLCTFELRYGLQDLPVFPVPAGMDATAYLYQLCEAALPRKHPEAE